MDVLDRIKWNDAGLVPAVVQDAENRQVLMVAWMNRESLRRTVVTGKATYWSRSRQEFWVKGETSGHTQAVKNIALDCDLDTVLLTVEQVGAACHEGYRTCFFRDLVDGELVVNSEKL
jgi:phosphoribosyl-AMP cyclohydrolase